MSIDKAIGLFDSGLGGLTVLKALEETLPHENLIYLGDTARVPYGNKSPETVTRYSIENTEFLIRTGIKALVVACNTSSALSLNELQNRFSIPILGVIEPGAQAAVKATSSQEVGIIGTEATLGSLAYPKAIQRLNPKIRVWGVACPLFVPLAEEGWLEEEVTEQIAKRYLDSFLQTPIDTLILGCTHYPLLKKAIGKVLGTQVHLVDSALETAQAVKSLLTAQNQLQVENVSRSISYFVTDSPERFKKVGRNFLNRALEGVMLVSY